MTGQSQPSPSPWPPRTKIPAVLMRAGTSKGLFLQKKHLPIAKIERDLMLLCIMGSQLGDPRQMDGLGGATSTTSKVAIIEKSSGPGIDIDYTFVQVSTTAVGLDMSGNCGNMAAGVGPFALDEGLVTAFPGQSEIKVHIYNTNTKKVLITTLAVAKDGSFQQYGDYSMPGVKGTGSRIKIEFLSPGGSLTGRLFPTGEKQEDISVRHLMSNALITVRCTLIDCANPFVLVDATSLPPEYHKSPGNLNSLHLIEAIRREASARFRLPFLFEEAVLAQATPKIVVTSRLPQSGNSEDTENAHLQVTAFSMGSIHPSLQLTGAICLAASMSIPGTVTSVPCSDGISSSDESGAFSN